MKLAIMQPYFFPYIGYWQLMAAVDRYVVYDDIQFTKGGWIRRNRILCNETDRMISLPLKKDSDYLDICDRYLADSFQKEKQKMLALIYNAYHNAPLFAQAYPVVEKCLNCAERNLFQYIYASIREIRQYIGIETPIVVSSTLEIDHSLRGKYKVLEICRKMEADTYINPCGGTDLYSKEEFQANDIDLMFLQPILSEYRQFDNVFVPNLSIIDVMMFNSKDRIREMLKEYTLL